MSRPPKRENRETRGLEVHRERIGPDGKDAEILPKEVLVLDLPPSVNRAFTWNPRGHHFVHTNEYSSYLDYGTYVVIAWCRKNKIKPISDYRPLYIKFFLKDSRTDSHNLKKALFDVLQKGGLFTNDKYILDRTVSVEIDKKNPRVELW